ncbi:MAG: hypothetical protein GY898_33015 [Proteobacteria bacterium]|nr:hypothetical protein [Pseudomonadota bacterium]
MKHVLVVAAALLLCACGPKEELPDIDPLTEGKIEGFPDPDAGGILPTPIGPTEGHGRAWTLKLGGSPRDYPGPRPTLRDDCAPTVVPCSAYKPRECGAAVDAALAKSPDLLRLDVPLSEPGAGHLARAAGRRVAAAGNSSHTRLHSAVPGRATLHGLWNTVGDADLLVWDQPLPDAATNGQFGLANLTLRSLGRRGVARFEGDKWDDDRLAALGLHLAAGGVVDGPMPPSGAAAVAWATEHPELFGRLRARIALIIPVRSLRRDGGDALATRIAGAARLLEASHFPWDAVVVGDGDRVSSQFNPGRLARHGLVVVVGGDSLHHDSWETVLGATTAPVLVWEEDASTLPEEIDPSRVQTRALAGLTELGKGETANLAAMVRTFDDEEEDLVDTARRSDGAIDANNLPLGVSVIPRWAPEAGLIVHHLVDVGRLTGKASKGRGDGTQIEMHYETAGDLAQCTAQWHLPGTGEAIDLPCRTNSLGPSIHVELPASDGEFPAWSVLATRLVIGDRPAALGRIQLDVSGSGEWRSDEVPFDVPVLDEDQIFAVTLPEWLEVKTDGQVDQLDPAPWPADLTLNEGRVDGTLTRTGEQLTVSTQMVTSKREIALTMTVQNVSDQPIEEVVALLCATSKGASPFPESGHANTYVWTAAGREKLEDRPVDEGEALYPYRTDITIPITALESTDGRWVMANAFESSTEAGGNGGGDGVCIHSRPRFGPLAPGQKQTRSGTLFIGPAGELKPPTEWTFEPPDRSADDGLPWVDACSEEGRSRLAPAPEAPTEPPPPPSDPSPEPTPS